MANAALRESEARVRTVITNAPIVLFALDKDGTFTLLEGKALDDDGRAARANRRPLRVRSVRQRAGRYRRDQPRPRRRAHHHAWPRAGAYLFEAQLEPITTTAATSSASSASPRTSRSASGRRTRCAKAKSASAVFEEGPLGMAIVGRDVKPIRANAMLCQMLGYTEEELSQNVLLRDHASRLRRHAIQRSPRSSLPERSPSFKVEKRYIKKNGEILPVMLVASAMRDRDGNITHSLGMMEDISERKRAEDALRESEQRLRWLDRIRLRRHGLRHRRAALYAARSRREPR